jgi:dihydroflavonol-4-reductase
MRLLVTGGTGFVGSHTARALADDGHELRLLVRDPARLAHALTPLGLDPATVDVVTASITDEGALRRAMAGCQGVVHAAAVYSWDPRRAEEMARTNAAATAAVVGTAARAGVERIVHVSSTVALSRRGGGRVDRDSPAGDAVGSYPRSKRASDEVVRALRRSGAPVVRVHPCGQYGPFDPHLSASNAIVRDIVRGRYPLWASGSMPWGDVRDTAATIAAVMAGRGGDEEAWIVPLHNLHDGELADALRQVTRRRIVSVVVPGRVMAPAMRVLRPVLRVLPDRVLVPLPNEGAADLLASATVFDDSATVEGLGVTRRPLVPSLRETVAWFVSSGHLSARDAGAAAP